MKHPVLFLGLITLLFVGCTKEANRKALDAYFKYDVNGASRMYKDEILLKDNAFDCYIKNDTLLYIHATKVYEGGGFIIKLHEQKEGTYSLDGVQKGFYEDKQNNRIYYTNSKNRGSLTIKRGTFKGKTDINTLQGTFNFEAVDPITHKTYLITNGSFLMELKTK
jgi:hypothetical protein